RKNRNILKILFFGREIFRAGTAKNKRIFFSFVLKCSGRLCFRIMVFPTLFTVKLIPEVSTGKDSQNSFMEQILKVSLKRSAKPIITCSATETPKLSGQIWGLNCRDTFINLHNQRKTRF